MMNTTLERGTYEKFKVTMDVYIVMLLCMFGISGNIFSIAVLRRDRIVRSTTGFLLQVLAMTDIFYLTTCLFFQTLNTMTQCTDWIPSMNFYWPYLAPVVWPCASIAQTCTVWLVLVVTGDRYIAICRPLHAPIYSTKSRMRKAVIIIWIVSILYNLPRFFERKVIISVDPATNRTFPIVVKTHLREDSVYVFVYKTCLFFIVRFLVPISFLAFFNTRLIQAIRESYKRHMEMPGECQLQRKGEKYSLTLVVVVLVFIICELPDFILRIWLSLKEFIPSIPFPLPALRYVNVISNMFLTINSCSNFVIYCFIGKRFRMILCQVLCRHEKKRRASHISMKLTASKGEEMTNLVSQNNAS